MQAGGDGEAEALRAELAAAKRTIGDLRQQLAAAQAEAAALRDAAAAARAADAAARAGAGGAGGPDQQRLAAMQERLARLRREQKDAEAARVAAWEELKAVVEDIGQIASLDNLQSVNIPRSGGGA